MKKVLILGAGLVVKPMVTYLLQRDYQVTIASPMKDRADEMIQGHPHGVAIDWTMDEDEKLGEMIRDHDLTVSFLPYVFHVQVAKKCLENKKNMVTASYVKPEMQALNEEAIAAGIIILNELGLDPGIDHMSAMRIIDAIHGKGGKVEEFYSLCGALPAPEAATNPFRYKFSWSPKGVVMAGNNDAKYLRYGKVVEVPTEKLFRNPLKVNFDSLGELDVYPNRDSISYTDIYSIPEARTVFRGTFRYPGWCEIIDAMKRLGLINYEKYHMDGMSYADLMALMINSIKTGHIKYILGVLALTASPAAAQQTVAGWTLSGNTQIQIGDNEFALNGSVEIEQGDTKLYAEHVDFFPNQDRAIATGNVLLSQGNNRIGADSADFNTKTRLGTFYHAYGIAVVQPPRRAPAPGAFAAPQLVGQENNVYFFGDVVEKTGPRQYKITNGGFTTCVQPTARWDLYADTVILHVNHYTFLRNAILKVKGVPMLYLPFMYYPTKEDNRATGFLIPTYGVSTIRGQSIHNAFFWAINRSQDATILHDWFSSAGQGVGSEYRYNYGAAANGTLSSYFLDQKGDATTGLPDERSFKIIGNANDALPGNFRARASVNYFSSLQMNQTFNMNVYDASQNQRQYGANVVGAWKNYSLNGTFNHSEYFYDSADSVVSGTTPNITLSRNERPLFTGSQVYFSMAGQFAHLDSETKTADGDVDKSVGRFDFAPQIRYPFKKWAFFTVNTALAWHETYYTRSLDPTDQTGNTVLNQGLNREYYTMIAQITGPVFNRIWNTPNNHYAEKFKHSIEPVFSIQRTSAIDDSLRSRIIQSDSVDYAVGGTTDISYGINNRFYAKRKTATSSQAQEILTVSLSQSYYTNATAAQYDTSYQTATAAPSNFSPVKLDVRAQPATATSTSVHVEVDSKYKQLRLLSANSVYNWSNRIQTSVGWSRTFFIKDLPGFNDPTTLNDTLNLTTNMQTSDNRIGVRYLMYYDILRSIAQQQGITAFYNAQCCGLAFQYQTYYLGGTGLSVTYDHRFFLSFTLAGLGNFSPFSGAMSGVPR